MSWLSDSWGNGNLFSFLGTGHKFSATENFFIIISSREEKT